MFQTLIAEDNLVFRQSLKDVLARRFPFMVVDEAADGDDALQQGTAHHHDLIFMDVRMPGKNGLEVTRAIKLADREAVVCIVTSHDLPEYRDAAAACGADHFVVKGESSESTIAGVVELVIAGRIKALIIEDNEAFRGVLNTALVQQWPDMLVAEASDGAAGMETALSFKPDLVFLDLHLANSNGLELVLPIKSALGQAIVVVVTGHDLPEYREAARRCGVSEYIVKDEEICEKIPAVVSRMFAADPRLAH